MDKLILGLFSTLLFVLSIPGTIALRNVLVITLLITLLFSVFKNKDFNVFRANKEYRAILYFLVIFILFVGLHSYFISQNINWSLNEFRAHIVYPFIYFLIGILIAIHTKISKKLSKEVVITAVFFSIFAHILYIDLVALDKLIHDGEMIRRYGGLATSPVVPNYLTNILLAILIGEFVYRKRTDNKILIVSDGLLYFLFVLCIFSTFVEALRLGDIALVFLGISASILYLYDNKNFSKTNRRFTAFFIIFTLTIPLIYNISTDPRWAKLIETVPLAIDSSNSQHWLDRSMPAPKTSSGYEVKGSNYERIAWAMKSLEIIYKNPLGIGYGRNSFGAALGNEYGSEYARTRTSHSSILDLTIGIGIFGTFLWLFVISKIASSGIKQYKRRYDFFSSFVLFLTLGFVGRSFVDANMRDHMFLEFMIIFGLALHFMFLERTNIETK